LLFVDELVSDLVLGLLFVDELVSDLVLGLLLVPDDLVLGISLVVGWLLARKDLESCYRN
jgi:hypothetical protein